MHLSFVIGTWEYVDHGTPTWLIWLVIAGGGAVVKAIANGGAKTPAPKTTTTKPLEASSIPVPVPVLLSPTRTICLVGRTSAGKSSLGNALTGAATFTVGVEHGTTTESLVVPFRGGYRLQDTPGLLDGEQYSRRVLDAAKASELVILLTTGQLYRQELDFLRELGMAQAAWNRTRRPSEPPRSLLVFLNACDLKERTMPSVQRETELAALKAQVSPWVDGSAVLSGAAAPVDGGSPWIASLEGYLAHFCQASVAAV